MSFLWNSGLILLDFRWNLGLYRTNVSNVWDHLPKSKKANVTMPAKKKRKEQIVSSLSLEMQTSLDYNQKFQFCWERYWWRRNHCALRASELVFPPPSLAGEAAFEIAKKGATSAILENTPWNLARETSKHEKSKKAAESQLSFSMSFSVPYLRNLRCLMSQSPKDQESCQDLRNTKELSWQTWRRRDRLRWTGSIQSRQRENWKTGGVSSYPRAFLFDKRDDKIVSH